jgi:two-component sensor histidine kinase
MQSTNVKSLMLLPMIFQDRVVGLVEISEGRVERTFTDHKISLLHLLASQTASAVENARLYERAQQVILERMQAEKQVKASLKEKEVLLNEIHHRVKNNLQVISSLLSLQMQQIEDPSVLEMFQESLNRIRSMALIHEKLYRSQDLANVGFGEYIRNLAGYLVRSYQADAGPVALKISADDVFLSVDTAIPCGLIINELVSNTLKHAFPATDGAVLARPDGAEHEIRIDVCSEPDNRFTLIVADNGIGFPQGLDFRKTESLGLQLVNSLVTQLKGTVELNKNGGTEFRITFVAAENGVA